MIDDFEWMNANAPLPFTAVIFNLWVCGLLKFSMVCLCLVILHLFIILHSLCII